MASAESLSWVDHYSSNNIYCSEYIHRWTRHLHSTIGFILRTTWCRFPFQTWRRRLKYTKYLPQFWFINKWRVLYKLLIKKQQSFRFIKLEMRYGFWKSLGLYRGLDVGLSDCWIWVVETEIVLAKLLVGILKQKRASVYRIFMSLFCVGHRCDKAPQRRNKTTANFAEISNSYLMGQQISVNRVTTIKNKGNGQNQQQWR